jgi:hypothetical protein
VRHENLRESREGATTLPARAGILNKCGCTTEAATSSQEELLRQLLPFLRRHPVQNNPKFLYWTCSLVVLGFMANRLDVSITGLQASAGMCYVPKWTEFAATLMVLTTVVMDFGMR